MPCPHRPASGPHLLFRWHGSCGGATTPMPPKLIVRATLGSRVLEQKKCLSGRELLIDLWPAMLQAGDLSAGLLYLRKINIRHDDCWHILCLCEHQSPG